MPAPFPDMPAVRAHLLAVVLVAAWMTMGWMLETTPNEYLLLGVAFTLFLHGLLRRRPLVTLWIRDATSFRPGRRGWMFVALAAAVPIHAVVRTALRWRTEGVSPEPAIVGWLACALTGALGVGLAMSRCGRLQWTSLLRCLATAGLLGSAVVVAAWLVESPRELQLTVGGGIRWFFLYLAVGFVLEEVFFRGALDAFVHPDPSIRGWGSAVVVSAIWGLWHLPITPLEDGWLGPTIWLAGFHTVIGVPLSLYWRRSGNLLVPVAAHALIDAVRNTLLG